MCEEVKTNEEINCPSMLVILVCRDETMTKTTQAHASEHSCYGKIGNKIDFPMAKHEKEIGDEINWATRINR